MQSKEIGEKILKNTLFGVRAEGVEVVMTIGTKAVRMDYKTANRLAVFLRHGGRQAKKNSHDGGIDLIGFADLTDAHADEMEAQMSRDRTAVFSR